MGNKNNMQIMNSKKKTEYKFSVTTVETSKTAKAITNGMGQYY